MKSTILTIAILLFSFLANAKPTDYQNLWASIDTCELEGLPQSAASFADSILKCSRSDKNYPQFIKAFIHRMKYRSVIQNDAFVTNLLEAERVADSVSFPVKNILHSMLGEMYWWYYENNRWKFHDRSQTLTIDSLDIQTWDLYHIVAKVVEHYNASLLDDEKLKTIKIADYKDIANTSHDLSQMLKPSLYDFVALRATEFFMREEPSLTHPREEFSMKNKDFFLPSDSFAQLKIQTSDTMSFKYIAMKLLQSLTQTHLKDSSNNAQIIIALKRLNFVYKNTDISNADERYIRYLELLEKKSADNELLTLVGLQIAEKYYQMSEMYRPLESDIYKWHKKLAIEKCKQIKRSNPNYSPTNELIKKIEEPELELTVEKENIPNEPFKALVGYRNVEKLFLNIYKTSQSELDTLVGMFKSNQNNYIQNHGYDYHFLRYRKPIEQISIQLPTDGDYQKHFTEIKLPELEKGIYMIVASNREDMDTAKSCFVYSLTNLTYLSCISRQNKDGGMDFFVLNRKTGEPMKDVKAECWERIYNNHTNKYESQLHYQNQTDKDGFLRIDNSPPFYVNFSYMGDCWSTRELLSSEYYQTFTAFWPYPPKHTQLQTFFFTDRAIYRPGQTIYFKGILLEKEKEKGNETTSLKTDYRTTVKLIDVNGKDVAALDVETNEFGSFSGSFTAPQKGLNGSLRLSCERSQTRIYVEDYKRPRFEVKFDTITQAYKLGDSATIKARIVSYSGVPVDGAKVKFRVMRQNSKLRSCWWLPNPNISSTEIVQGKVISDKLGEATIRFIFEADDIKGITSKGIYNFEVFVNATDLNGETHVATTNLNVGYRDVFTFLDIPQYVDRNDTSSFALETVNSNGKTIAANGNIHIYKLKSPQKAYRKSLWDRNPDKFVMTREEYAKWIPDDEYQSESNIEYWPIDQQLINSPFNTSTDKVLSINNLKQWSTGAYKVVISTIGRNQEAIRDSVFISIFDKNSKASIYPTTFSSVLLKEIVEPGQNAELLLNSEFRNAKMLVEIENKDKAVQREWISMDNSQKLISTLIKESDRGNIGIGCQFVYNNRYYNQNHTITVPYSNKELFFRFETFRNKLKPGEKEQWNLIISNKSGKEKSAEMLACMYDASLDAFTKHRFRFNYLKNRHFNTPWSFSLIYPKANSSFQNYSFQSISSSILSTSILPIKWYGFSYYVPRMDGLDNTVTLPTQNIKIVSSEKAAGTDITGTIVDSKGKPIIGMSVVIMTLNGIRLKSTISDIAGNFRMTTSYENVNLFFKSVGFVGSKLQLKKQGKIKIVVTIPEETTVLQEIQVSSASPLKMIGSLGVEERDLPFTVQSVKTKSVVETNQISDQMQGLAKEPEILPRTNFAETAFFYPHLQTDEKGEVTIKFTVPQSLTRWKMLGFAHTKDLKYGFVENELVTQKELMVTPNAPRFFREGDTINFTAKVAALTDKLQTGKAHLMLFDALSMKPIDRQLNNLNAQQSFSAAKGQSANMSWKLIIPKGLQAVTYRVTAQSESFSDGEEAAIPVLTNRQLVTESMPLYVNGRQTKAFTLNKLLNNQSTTLQNHKLTLEFTSNPAWYAIQALPYLMEYPYECAEQTFSRFYANSLASHIANSNPSIKQVFAQWKNGSSESLVSNLEKNQELKSLLLEETPWLRDAQNETERKKRVALLFDLNHMSNELDRALTRLRKMQTGNGAWPWFDGMPVDRYITQHIVCGMGKLNHLGVKEIKNNRETWQMTSKALGYLDERIVDDFEQLKRLEKANKLNLDEQKPDYQQIQYLYARSFFADQEMNTKTREAYDYFAAQARTYKFNYNNYLQGMIALALSRNGDTQTPVQIIRSLKERALKSDELGMYWKSESGWYWHQAPVETQALLIEAFDEIAHDTASVNDMKLWLLKQKQTQDWRTTRATVEASYALLLRGTNWLTTENTTSIQLGNQKVDPSKMPDIKAEAGTGYFKTSWTGSEITPSMAKVTLTKTDNGPAWGAIYWQYFEQLDKITASETSLKLKKQLYVERNRLGSKVIVPVSDTTRLQPGDLIKVRIELRTDRNMEYVHMKDMRAAGFEPVNVLSGYKYQDGLGYYESTRDAATNFFISWLPKGTYVFEYSLRVSLCGNFSNGITTIQCMYAPEFTSHSEGVRVSVK